MKKILYTILLALTLFTIAKSTFAARTDGVWDNLGTYTKTTMPSGLDILVNGSNHYINFNTVVGTNGYGFRDNGGTMEFKNSGGSWTGVGTGGGGGTPGGSTTQIQYNNAGAFGGVPGLTYNGSNIIFNVAPNLDAGFIANGLTTNSVLYLDGAKTSATSANLTFNGTTLGANALTIGGNAITLGGAFSTSGAFTTAFTVTANTAVTLPISGTLYGTATGSFNSSQLMTSLSDETGTGAAVFATSPFLTTPIVVTSARIPLVIGGATTTSTLLLRSTSAAGTTGADIVLQTGNNGATEVGRFTNAGIFSLAQYTSNGLLKTSGSNGTVGVATLGTDYIANLAGTYDYHRVTGATRDRYYSSPNNGKDLTTIIPLKDTLYALPLVIGKGATIDKLKISLEIAQTGGLARIGLYTDDGNGYPATLLYDSGDVTMSAGLGTKGGAVDPSVAVTPGLYWMAYLTTATTTMPSVRGFQTQALLPLLGGGASINASSTDGGVWAVALTYTSLPSTFTAGGTVSTTSTSFPYMQVRLN